jgi:hypothetical protein
MPGAVADDDLPPVERIVDRLRRLFFTDRQRRRHDRDIDLFDGFRVRSHR